MFVTMEGRTSCLFCGCRLRVLRFASVRVNRRSLRETGVSLTAAVDLPCPECGARETGSVIPADTWRLEPGDAAKVAAYRERRWGTGVAALCLRLMALAVGRVEDLPDALARKPYGPDDVGLLHALVVGLPDRGGKRGTGRAFAGLVPLVPARQGAQRLTVHDRTIGYANSLDNAHWVGQDG